MVKKVTVLVVLMILLLPLLERLLGRWPGVRTAVKRMLLGVYLCANVYETLMFRIIRPEQLLNLELLRSWRKAFDMPDGLLSLLRGTASIASPSMASQLLLNILLYIPLGYLLPAAYPRLKGWQVAVIGAALSTLTEAAQLIFRIGWCECDDVLHNLLGCLVGLLMYCLLFRRGGEARDDLP